MPDGTDAYPQGIMDRLWAEFKGKLGTRLPHGQQKRGFT